MRLTATIEDGQIVVRQDGGYGPASRSVLKAVGHGARCIDGATWVYPAWPATVIGIKQAADLLDMDLDLYPEVRELGEKADNQTAHEHSIRKLMQKYMDDKTLPLGQYESRSDPDPWRHQQLAYHWGMRVNSLYVAHKPGLGKTRTGSDLIRGRIDAGHVREPESVWLEPRWSEITDGRPLKERWATVGGVLIVCPKVVLGTWSDELLKWQGIPAISISANSRGTKLKQAGTPSWVHICTYGSLSCLEGNIYDGIIADELHSCAWSDTVRWSHMMHFRKHARWVVGLSGTPLSNMLPSLWGQYYWLDQGRTLEPSFEAYLNRYFEGSGRNPDPIEGSAEQIAKRISRCTYFLTMPEAFPEKPQKIQQIQHVGLNQDQVTYYKRVRDDARAEIQASRVNWTSVTDKIIKLLQIQQGWVKDENKEIIEFSSAKLRALRSMLIGENGTPGDLSGERVVVWCRFRHDLQKVVQMLEDAGAPTLYLHGGLNDSQREAVKNAWNKDHRWRFFVGMIQIGIGINLHAPKCVDEYGNPARCHTSVFYGLDWKVTQLEQAMDRIYRGDQVETCLYRYILSERIPGDNEDPMDKRVYDTLQAKLNQAVEVSEESVDYIRRLLAA